MRTISEEVKQRLSSLIKSEENFEFIDERNDGRHFLLKLKSEVFEGKSRLERQKLVYSFLDDLIKKDHIHALRMQLKSLNE